MDLSLDLRSIIAIVAIASAILTAYFSNFWRNRKGLIYEIASELSPVSKKGYVRDVLQVLYEDRLSQNVRVFLMKIVNNGQQPIDEKDFKKPLTFIFDDEAEVLYFEIEDIYPKNLDAQIVKEGNKLVVSPLLLNKKDFIKIKIIVDTDKAFINCDSRIIGVNEIKQVDASTSKFREFTYYTAILYFPSTIALSYAFYYGAGIDLIGSYQKTFESLTLIFSAVLTIFYIEFAFIKVKEYIKSKWAGDNT